MVQIYAALGPGYLVDPIRWNQREGTILPAGNADFEMADVPASFIQEEAPQLADAAVGSPHAMPHKPHSAAQMRILAFGRSVLGKCGHRRHSEPGICPAGERPEIFAHGQLLLT